MPQCRTYIEISKCHPVGIVKLVVIFLNKALSNLLPYFFIACHVCDFGSVKIEQVQNIGVMITTGD